MSRAIHLARQAIAKHQLRGQPLVDAIADVIRLALDEHANADRLAPLPRACGAVIALLQDNGRMTPKQISIRRGTTRQASVLVLRRLVHAHIVVRVRHATYCLASGWARAAAAYVDQYQERLSKGGRTAANAMHARRRQGAA